MRSHEKQAIINEMSAEKLTFDGRDVANKADELDAGISQLVVPAVEGLPYKPRFDAGESAFLTRQLLFIQQREVTQLFTQLKATKLIPLDTSIPSGADSFSTPVWNVYGKASLVANYATDFPTSDAAQSEVILPIKSIGNAFQYSVQDLRRAAMAGGMPLDQRRASVARMVSDKLVETVMSLGDATSGLLGFLKTSGVTLLTAGGGVTGTWSGASGATIYADLMLMAAKVQTQSQDVWHADTIVLGTAAYARAAQVPANSFNQESALSAFLRTNPFGITNIDQWVKCDLANAAGNGPRAVVYRRGSECVDCKIPQGFEVFAPQQKGLGFIVPCHTRVGGSVVYHPASMVYVDGL